MRCRCVMMGSPHPRPGAWSPLAAAALLLLAAGCADEPALDVPGVTIVVTSEEADLPLSGVKIVLMDADTNLPAAGPATTDAAGECRLGPVAGGRLRLIVFGGPLWGVHHQPDWYGDLRTTGGRPAGSQGSAVMPAAPEVVNHVTMRPRGRPGALPRFAGSVIDAETGRPLAQAFVTLSPWPVGYGGGVTASDDVTGPDGAFVVYDIPIALNPDTGIGFQVLPLIVSRHGYRTVRWTYDPPGGLDYADVAGLSIALEPLRSQDTGSLSGLVRRDGRPLPDLLVGLGSAPTDKGAIGVAAQVTRTDGDGRFRFDQLPPGAYVVHPGFLTGDGAWFAGAQASPVTVGADGTADAGALDVLHEIEPALGNRYRLAATDTIVTFGWSAVPGAAAYVWFLDGGDEYAEAPAESVTVALPPLEAGLHSWQVTALDGAGEVVGVMQNDGWFRQD